MPEDSRATRLALDILKAYHLEIKSVHPADTSAVEREKGQSKAIEVAEKFIQENCK